MQIALLSEALSPWQRLSAFQEDHPELRSRSGATAVFVGTMRDFNDDHAVERMFLEHYPGMTERQLERIIAGVTGAHPLDEVLVLHRIGDLYPGDPIVLVAVWSAHRNEAFAACRKILEELKHQAPFWKKEYRRDGEHWVACNTPADGTGSSDD